MSKRKQKSFASFIIVMLLISQLFPGVATTYAEEGDLPDGVYEADYRYLKDGSSETSAAHGYLYVENTGRFIVEAEQIFFEHEITAENEGYIPYIGFRLPGYPKATISGADITGMDGYQEVEPSLVDQADENGNYVVRYELEEVTKAPDILIHVYMEGVHGFPGGVYDYWYNVQLEIDTSTLPIEVEADKTSLIDLIAEAEALFEAIPSSGTFIPNVISNGEHTYSTSQINNRLTNAKNVVNDPSASQAEVEAVSNNLQLAMDSVKRDQYFETGTLRFIVLDSIEEGAALSEHTGDFGDKAVILEQFGTHQARVNIPVVGMSDNLDIRSSMAPANGEVRETFVAPIQFVRKETEEISWYQASARHANADDSVWQGLSFLRYIDEGVEKEVYLSFNVSQLNELEELFLLAEAFNETAEIGTANGQFDADHDVQESLQSALEKAEQVSSNLAATRPEIAEAYERLDEALTEFLSIKQLEAGQYELQLADISEELADSVDSIYMNVDLDGTIDLEVTRREETTQVELVSQKHGEAVASRNEGGRTYLFSNVDLTHAYQLIVQHQGGQEQVFVTYFGMISSQVVEEAPPGNEEEPPGNEEDQPGNEEESPGNEEDQPGNEEEPPGNEEDQPGNEEEPPGNEEDQPGNEEESPGNEEDQPGNEEEPPGNEEDQPGNEEEPPGNEEDQPGNEEEPNDHGEVQIENEEEVTGDRDRLQEKSPDNGEKQATEESFNESSGEALPNTSTNLYVLLLLGSALFLLGGFAYLYMRKRLV
ncbi:NEAT domain-containing protein [Halalkalibacter sp. AB-rgal2]|uniref:NEAT domain-containing protein n=1 Tax=Halalkalibacter sp. AB-rgal2 TaxID=3242695 RepID=UPI00359D2DDB